MRRISFLLVVTASVFAVVSGSALAAGLPDRREPARQQLAADDRRHCSRGADPDRVERLVGWCDADRLHLRVAAL